MKGGWVVAVYAPFGYAPFGTQFRAQLRAQFRAGLPRGRQGMRSHRQQATGNKLNGAKHFETAVATRYPLPATSTGGAP